MRKLREKKKKENIKKNTNPTTQDCKLLHIGSSADIGSRDPFCVPQGSLSVIALLHIDVNIFISIYISHIPTRISVYQTTIYCPRKFQY